MRQRLKAAAQVAGLLFAWTWLVCFPNPVVLPRNLYRYFRFPVDPGVLDLLPEGLPEKPAEIEEFLKEYVPFQWDWKTYGVPWMMPDPLDVVRRRRGDCESIAVVFASVLEARGLPYDVQASFSHVWIDYPGRRDNAWEQDGTSYFGRRKGRLFIKPPSAPYLRRHLLNQKEGLWDAMPAGRKLLLILGWLTLPAVWHRRRGRRVRRAAPEPPPQ